MKVNYKSEAPQPKPVPKGMTELKRWPDGIITDSYGRQYRRAPDGSLRRLFKK